MQALLDAGADTEPRTKVCSCTSLCGFVGVTSLTPHGPGAGRAYTVPCKLHARPRRHGRSAAGRRCQARCCRCELSGVSFLFGPLSAIHASIIVRLYASGALSPAQKWNNTGMMRAVDRDYVEVVEMIGKRSLVRSDTHVGSRVLLEFASRTHRRLC